LVFSNLIEINRKMRDNNLFTKRNDAIHRVNFKQLKSEPPKTHIRSDQRVVRIINNYGKLPSKKEQVFILTTYGRSEVNSENWFENFSS